MNYRGAFFQEKFLENTPRKVKGPKEMGWDERTAVCRVADSCFLTFSSYELNFLSIWPQGITRRTRVFLIRVRGFIGRAEGFTFRMYRLKSYLIRQKVKKKDVNTKYCVKTLSIPFLLKQSLFARACITSLHPRRFASRFPQGPVIKVGSFNVFLTLLNNTST